MLAVGAQTGQSGLLYSLLNGRKRKEKLN